MRKQSTNASQQQEPGGGFGDGGIAKVNMHHLYGYRVRVTVEGKDVRRACAEKAKARQGAKGGIREADLSSNRGWRGVHAKDDMHHGIFKERDMGWPAVIIISAVIAIPDSVIDPPSIPPDFKQANVGGGAWG